MNEIHKVVLATLLFLIAKVGYADTAADLRSLLDNYETAVNELDLDLAQKIWSQEEPITFIHPRGHQKGWNEIKKEFYLETMGTFSKRQLKIRDVSIQVLNEEAAWGDFYWDFQASFPDGKLLKSTGRETQVWKKEADGWKIIHVHYSGPPTQESGEGF